MKANVRELSSLVLGLPERSRAMLADLLLDSLDDGSVESHEAAWLELAAKRDGELDAGTAQPLSHQEIMDAARNAVRCAR